MLVIFKKMRSVFAMAWMEYRQWIFNPRILLIGILCVFSKMMVSDALVQQSVETGQKLHYLEPFIAMGNSNVLLLFFPFVFLILMSDFPAMRKSTLFVMKRTGKQIWFYGQILFLLMSTMTFLLAVLGFGCLSVIGYAAWGNSWSDAVTKYAAMFPDKYNNFTSQYIPVNLYNQMSIGIAFLNTILLLFCYLLLLAMILMIWKLCLCKTAGLLTNVTLIGIGAAACTIRFPVMWMLPMANSLIWLHYTKIASEPIYPLWASYAYFGIGIGLLLIISRIIMKNTNAIGIGMGGD